MRPLYNLNSHLTLLGIAASSVLLSGCNDEVFVKPLPEISSVALSPEGDHKVIDLGVAGAGFMYLSSTVDSFHGTIDTLTPDGEVELSPPFTGATYIPGGLALHSTGDLSVDLTIMATSEGRVTIDLDHCYSASPASLTVGIDYGYGQVNIPLTVKAIEPFDPVAIDYPDGFFSLSSNELMEASAILVVNDSSDSLPALFNPWEAATAEVMFITADADSPGVPLASPGADVALPSVGEQGPGLYGFSAPYIPDKRCEIPVSGLPEKIVRVMVPPHSKRRYVTFIERQPIYANYRITFASPSVSPTPEARGQVRVAYPVDYYIGYNEL